MLGSEVLLTAMFSDADAMLCVWDDSGPLRRWLLPICDLERPTIIFGISGSGMEDMGIAGVYYDLET
jgi:hypothetical protein